MSGDLPEFIALVVICHRVVHPTNQAFHERLRVELSDVMSVSSGHRATGREAKMACTPVTIS